MVMVIEVIENSNFQSLPVSLLIIMHRNYLIVFFKCQVAALGKRILMTSEEKIMERRERPIDTETLRQGDEIKDQDKDKDDGDGYRGN